MFLALVENMKIHSKESLWDDIVASYYNLDQQKKNGATPTNAEFLSVIISDLPEGARAVITAKSGDPQQGGWFPQDAQHVDRVCRSDRNTYFNCASFMPGENGALVARKDNAAAYHALVLDDVGPKVDRSLLGTVKPTWEIETSPGNWQIGYKLNPPLFDAAEVDRFQQKILAAGLTDKGALGMNRWMRLPNGINGKPKYKADGKPFTCRLHTWNPDVAYAAGELLAALVLQADEVKPAPVWPKATNSKGTDFVTLSQVLYALDPDCGYRDWLTALMVVYHETGGSDEGLDLADAWSEKGKSYKNRAEIESKWRSFSLDVANPVTIATLIWLAKKGGANIAAILGQDHTFEPCAFEVVPED